jgi:hypothetical protein
VQKRIPILTVSIKHNFGSPKQSNLGMKKKKKALNQKRNKIVSDG